MNCRLHASVGIQDVYGRFMYALPEKWMLEASGGVDINVRNLLSADETTSWPS